MPRASVSMDRVVWRIYVARSPQLSLAVRHVNVHTVLANPRTSIAEPWRDWLHFGYIGPYWAMIWSTCPRKRKAPQL